MRKDKILTKNDIDENSSSFLKEILTNTLEIKSRNILIFEDGTKYIVNKAKKNGCTFQRIRDN